MSSSKSDLIRDVRDLLRKLPADENTARYFRSTEGLAETWSYESLNVLKHDLAQKYSLWADVSL